MPDYRRAFAPGGTFFFTVVTANRTPILCTRAAIPLLRLAFAETRRKWPFTIDAIVILPDHLHALRTLPKDDHDFSIRWANVKKKFTQGWLAASGGEQPTSESNRRHRRRGVWQRKFWEHTIRDEGDFGRHFDYIHRGYPFHSTFRHRTAPVGARPRFLWQQTGLVEARGYPIHPFQSRPPRIGHLPAPVAVFQFPSVGQEGCV